MIQFNIYGSWKHLGYPVRKTLQSIVKAIYIEENLNGHYEVSFIFCNNEEIHKINMDYRHIDRPTDVISFAEIDESENRVLPSELGDIFINYEKVVEQASEYKHSNLREFAFLATHGMYHLLGYDHQTKEEEEKMFLKQDKILTKLNIMR